MQITIYQPRYFPQLHYFNRMLSVDTFVFLDNAQYTKSLRQKTPNGEKRIVSYQSDTPIKTAQGETLLTIPICHHGYSRLDETQIDYSQKWHKKHMTIMKSAYQHAPHYVRVSEQLRNFFFNEYPTLAALNIATVLWSLSFLLGLRLEAQELSVKRINGLLKKRDDIRLKKILLASELGIDRPEGLQKGTQWTAQICVALGATEYIYGAVAKDNYMDMGYYKKHGIVPLMQRWDCEEYVQQFPKTSFLPNLSIIDLLCNVERENALHMLYATENI